MEYLTSTVNQTQAADVFNHLNSCIQISTCISSLPQTSPAPEAFSCALQYFKLVKKVSEKEYGKKASKVISREEQYLLHQCKHLLLSLHCTHTYVVKCLNYTQGYAQMLEGRY